MANFKVMLVLAGQSFLGLAVTACLKYGGALIKTIASSAISAVLLMVDWTAFGVPLTVPSLAGVGTVCYH